MLAFALHGRREPALNDLVITTNVCRRGQFNSRTSCANRYELAIDRSGLAQAQMARPKSTSHPQDTPPQPPPAREAEIAGYIAEITGELAQMAQSARLDVLAHFLTLARLEAELAARRARDGDGAPR
ncbi:MAG: hypothetical protein JNK46_16520 [Methylobacteriaceae bacterium]|nr:hypothetical protein [Methylobacteriaceae bacterium]